MSPAEARAVLPIVGTRAAQVGVIGAVALAPLFRVLPFPWFVGVTAAGGVAVTAGLSLYFVRVFDPRTTFGYPLLVRPSAPRDVSLTFDDGPHPETTPVLLETLARSGARATFFLIAETARAYPDLTRRIAAEGHSIGLHGLRHETMVLKSANRLTAEWREAEAILSEILGGPLPGRLLRPPHGFKTPTVCRTACQQGWTLVAWSADGRDYDALSADAIVRNIRDAGLPGAIVLLHERPGSTETVAALEELLREGSAQGYNFVGL
ncbi:MAG: polysaccharide deacetylase family protein [Capsulimonadales bacterium]|nr:polysaccharide deacetylase family protein [Capsulimonadales bacterium]